MRYPAILNNSVMQALTDRFSENNLGKFEVGDGEMWHGGLPVIQDHDGSTLSGFKSQRMM